jgi:hypothetical protein
VQPLEGPPARSEEVIADATAQAKAAIAVLKAEIQSLKNEIAELEQESADARTALDATTASARAPSDGGPATTAGPH